MCGIISCTYRNVAFISELCSPGREGGCLTNTIKRSMMIVAVLSVMAGGIGEGGRKASWRKECLLSLSPTLITYSSLNYLLTLIIG